VVLVQDDCVALIERKRSGRHYYAFAGGGIEPGESPAAAAIREAWEELGVEVRIDREIARVRDPELRALPGEPIHHIFLAEIVGGCFGQMHGPELAGPPEAGTYQPVWLPLAELDNVEVWPATVAALVSSAARTSWPSRLVELAEAPISPNPTSDPNT
jgi:8-oxo-dGTP pyrophosphatase MutT (NUDIX family)